MRTTIVIPTYNERDNMVPLLDALRALPVPDLTVLVVDDGSPDGTADVVREVAARDRSVALLQRPGKAGLGRAYLAAFRALLSTPPAVPFPRPDIIVQMDADFSHDPADVPRLVHALETADVVIGSRYVSGGRVLNWSWMRRLLSAGANVYARRVLGLPVHDLTAGFCAWRAPVLQELVARVRHSEGYSFLIELKTLAARRDARFTEVPITFAERRAGRSKISRAIVWEALIVVLLLRFQRP